MYLVSEDKSRNFNVRKRARSFIYFIREEEHYISFKSIAFLDFNPLPH